MQYYECDLMSSLNWYNNCKKITFISRDYKLLAKINVDQILTKANLFARKNEISEAKKLYKLILDTFPKNSRAREALVNLNNKSNEDQLNRLPNFIMKKIFKSN